jgi:hypothetical protein
VAQGTASTSAASAVPKSTSSRTSTSGFHARASLRIAAACSRAPRPAKPSRSLRASHSGSGGGTGMRSGCCCGSGGVSGLRRSIVGNPVNPAAAIADAIRAGPAKATVCPAATAALATRTSGRK